VNRRAFVTGLGAALAAPLVVKAQPPLVVNRQPTLTIGRVGYLELGTAIVNAEFREAFDDALRDQGGDKILIWYQWAEERTPTVVSGMTFVNDPFASGFVAKVAPPDITGLSLQVPETSGKRVQLLREVAPTVARIAVLSDTSPAGLSTDVRQAGLSTDVRETEAAARTLGVPVHVMEVPSSGELERAFAVMAQEGETGVIVVQSRMLYAYRYRIARLAKKHHLPTVTSVEAGGLISYGPDLPDLARRAAYLMDKLLRGAKPADLPVEQPTKLKLTINLKTAKALGLTIPPSLLLRADQVLE
jgi:putative ABC transport system substrate-binding protein